MPYRIASDPWVSRVVPAVPPPRRRRALERIGLILAGVGSIMLFTVGIDRICRPTLGPDEVPEREPFTFRLERPMAFEVATHCECEEEAAPLCNRYRYDVDRALRSDEPMEAEIEPEGTGPARRRYVRPDPRDLRNTGIIEGTITLASEVTAF